jgi:myo-inositol catabolism protein IolC
VAAADEQPWALLAFDHRERAFASVRPLGMDREQIRDAKGLIFDAFTVAVERGLEGVRAGILVDEEFGAPIARRAAGAGHAVSMPVERAFERVFAFEYGADYQQHVLAFRPTYAKALVKHRTTDPAEDKRAQLARLRALSDFLAEHSIGFMLELIVGQANETTDSIPTVDLEQLCGSMAEMQSAGIQVDLWKIEGIASRDAAARVAQQAAAGRHPATCVVLGNGAASDVLARWLDVAAVTPGFSGFAIGRSIWGAPVAGWLDGRLGRDDAIERIASTYRSCARRYVEAMIG